MYTNILTVYYVVTCILVVLHCIVYLQHLEDLGDIMGQKFDHVQDVVWSPFTLCHALAIREV